MELLIKLQKVFHKGFIRDYFKTLEDREKEKKEKEKEKEYDYYNS